MSGLRDQTAAAAEAHRPYGLDCKCGLPINSDAGWARHFADVLSLALGLTEERRTLTDGWIQPTRNAVYYAQGLEPPPAVITHECRWVSGWSVVGETKP